MYVRLIMFIYGCISIACSTVLGIFFYKIVIGEHIPISDTSCIIVVLSFLLEPVSIFVCMLCGVYAITQKSK